MTAIETKFIHVGLCDPTINIVCPNGFYTNVRSCLSKNSFCTLIYLQVHVLLFHRQTQKSIPQNKIL